MQTKISTKGQVVLPQSIRRRLGLHPGEQLKVQIKDGCIVLTPHNRRRTAQARIVLDEITGIPVLDAGKDAPILTSEDVAEMLSDFP